MPAVAVAKRERQPRPRDFPRVFELFTRVQLEEGERARRDQLNPYKRRSLQLAFQAGWNVAPHIETVMRVVKSDLMSDLGKAAFWAGAETALADSQQPPPGGKDESPKQRRRN